jgi:hypothetical protein
MDLTTMDLMDITVEVEVEVETLHQITNVKYLAHNKSKYNLLQ